MTEPALSFDGLGFAYRPGAWVVRHVTGRVEGGGVLAILGPNGQGKTTLLRLLLGDLKPQEGCVGTTRRRAFVPQLFEVAFDYRVLDMVLMGRARRIGLFAQPSRADEASALAALDRLGLADLAPRPFGELSGGQRQLVVLARALAAEAEVLILDEPTSSLDLRNQEVVLDWMSRLAREYALAVVFTTHQPSHAVAIADDALLLQGPEASLFGPVGEVVTDERLRTLYGVELRRVDIEHRERRFTAFVPLMRVLRPEESCP